VSVALHSELPQDTPPAKADQYAAILAKWFGIPDVDLDIVAPDLSNFAQRDLGFMIA